MPSSIARLIPLRQRVQDAFFCYGWLLPALLPLTQLGGRALYNVVCYSYILWGLLSLAGSGLRTPRGYLILYAALLGAFLLGVPGAQDSGEAFKAWFLFALHSLTALFTLAALQHSPDNLQRLQDALGRVGVLALVLVYAMLGWILLSGQPFSPEQQLKEDNLPWLLPFALAWCGTVLPGRWRRPALAALLVAAFAYIVLSTGRAALLGALVMLALFGLLVWRWPLRRALPLMGGGLLLVVAVTTVAFLNGSVRTLGWEHPLDGFTSGRTLLWRQALAQPPEQPWIGVGMENVHYRDAILTIRTETGELRVQHLHNFVLDSWYETGYLGAGLLLVLLGYLLLWRVWRGWGGLDAAGRRRAGVWLAAA
ncbi:MAG TPA: O-antigen ligase family protein, partial [Candidatus Competibacteraceae bacterium]|nr:O-antigen ligase family protein [Candidatus Competibacteraceae bacterium]